MTIYELRPDVEQFRWLTLERDEDFDVLHDLDGSPVSDRWRSLPTRWIDDGVNGAKPTSDFPTLGTTPVFSRRAADALLDVLVEAGELLPLAGAGDGYLVYNVTRLIDALDEERSELKRFTAGGIMRVSEYAFHPHRIGRTPVFKVPQLRGVVFVTDVFTRRVAAADLTGFECRQVWSEAA